MLIKSLHLQGFTSYIDSKIDFKDNFVSTIIAPNGYGKSSILEAITTALFYRARGTDNRGVGMDNLINNSCDEFIITLEFILDNITYKIIRKKVRDGKHELEFYIDNIPQTEKINDTQNKINSIIKMNYETFLDTVCIGQGMSNNFMKKKPNERKDVFVEILNLNEYTELEKKAKELKKKVSQDLDTIETKLNIISESIDKKQEYIDAINTDKTQSAGLELKIKDLNKRLEDELFEKSQYLMLKKTVEDLVKQKKTLEDNISQLEQKIQNLKVKNNSIVTKYKEEKAKLEELQTLTFDIQDEEIFKEQKQNIEEKISSLKNKWEELTHQLSEYNTKFNINRNKINELKEKFMKLEKYNDAVCELCGNQITPEHKQSHLSSLKSEAKFLSDQNKEFPIESLKTEIEEINDEIKDGQNKIKDIDIQIRNNYEEISKAKNNKIKIETLEENLKNYKERVNEIKETHKDYEEQLKSFKEQLSNINVEEVPEQVFQDETIKTEIESFQMKLNELNSDIKFNEKKLLEVQDNEDLYKDLNKQKSELTLKLSDYDSLSVAFSKKGIQADIIANVLPDIENEINNVLQVLFNNGINIEFTTQKESKSNTTLETLDIIIHDKDRDRTYDTYSGGEKFRIDFAFHIGLSKFLAKRANANIQFFMVDEGLGSQDDEGKENFILVINKLRNLFDQIFIITHIDEMKDAFDSKILINKDPINGSKIILQ